MNLPLAAALEPSDMDAARRWRALVGCARIRPLGSAGLVTPNALGHAHLGLELWTHFPDADRSEGEHARGIEWLTKFADAAASATGLGAPLSAPTLSGLEQRLESALPPGDGDYDDGFRDALHSFLLALEHAGVPLQVLDDALTTAFDAHANNT